MNYLTRIWELDAHILLPQYNLRPPCSSLYAREEDSVDSWGDW